MKTLKTTQMGKKGKKGKKKKKGNKKNVSYKEWKRFVYSIYPEWDDFNVLACTRNTNVVFIWSSTLCEAMICSIHNASRLGVLSPTLNGTGMSIQNKRFVDQYGKVGAYVIHIEDYLGKLPPKLTCLSETIRRIKNPYANYYKDEGTNDLLKGLCFSEIKNE